MGLVNAWVLGAHWLPLPVEDGEILGFVTRLWVVREELGRGHGMPFWSPYHMCGSSLTLGFASGGAVWMPWLALGAVVDLVTAGRLTVLLAIVGSGPAMFLCARRLVKERWAAALAGVAYALHPYLLVRGVELQHVAVAVAFLLAPLCWAATHRALTGRPGSAAACAVLHVLLLWTHAKLAVLLGLVELAYVLRRGWRMRAARRRAAVRSLGWAGAALVGLSAFIVVPALWETRSARLLLGASGMPAWQERYAVHGLLGLVDRGGGLTRAAGRALQSQIDSGALGVNDGSPAAQRTQRRIDDVVLLQVDAPGLYVGLAWLGALAAGALSAGRRRAPLGPGFTAGAALFALAASTGHRSLLEGSARGLDALWGLPSLPAGARWAALGLAALVPLGLALAGRRSRRALALAGLAAATLAVPWFSGLAQLPLFRELRAPLEFWSFLAPLLLSLLLASLAARRGVGPVLVGLAAVLFAIDSHDVRGRLLQPREAGRRLADFEAAYRALARDHEPVKTYTVGLSNFHLLGPLWSGKALVDESFASWTGPLGTGLLAERAWQGPAAEHKAFLDLVGARYVVFDLSDPLRGLEVPGRLLGAYRRALPLVGESRTVAVFANPGARALVTAYATAIGYAGDVRDSAPLSLQWAARQVPLLAADSEEAAATARALVGAVQGAGEPPPAWRGLPRASAAAGPEGRLVPLSGLAVERAGAGELHAAFTAPEAAVVVVAEGYYPFWRAELDGRAVPLLRASTGLMAVAVGPGPHRLGLRYVPPAAFSAAAGLSALTALGLLGLSVRGPRAA